MQHPIDPKIDCVFKALLGAEANRRLLTHFLNAVLGAALPAPIRQAEILNPYNEREFLDDKLSACTKTPSAGGRGAVVRRAGGVSPLFPGTRNGVGAAGAETADSRPPLAGDPNR